MKQPNSSAVAKAFRVNFPTLLDNMQPSEQRSYTPEQLQELYKFRPVWDEGFTSTPCVCQVLDDEELANFRDFTKGR